MESWGDFANDLCVLADRAYPELQEESREYISFEVRQHCPKTVSQAVAATNRRGSCTTSKHRSNLKK